MKHLRSVSVVAVLIFTLACATGTVTTVYGPRPAAEVQSQDTVGDILASLDAGYTAAVSTHDAAVATDAPAVHAAHRATILKEHDALVAAWNVLIIWKQAAGSGYSPASVVQPLISASPAFLQLAVDLKVMTQAQADSITKYIVLLFPVTPPTLLTAKPPNALPLPVSTKKTLKSVPTPFLPLPVS
jgi:hypothetical protein